MEHFYTGYRNVGPDRIPHPLADPFVVKLSFGIKLDKGREYECVDISEYDLDDYPELVFAE